MQLFSYVLELKLLLSSLVENFYFLIINAKITITYTVYYEAASVVDKSYYINQFISLTFVFCSVNYSKCKTVIVT